MNSRPLFRKLRKTDIPELLNISRENMADIIWDSWGVSWRDEDLIEMLEDPGAYTEVMERDGRIVGYYCIELQPDSLFINAIQVRKDCIGEGLGKTMMERIEAIATLHGLTSIELWVQSANCIALRFYRRLGYKFARRKGNNYLMRKNLNDEL